MWWATVWSPSAWPSRPSSPACPWWAQRVTVDQREGLQSQVQDIAAVFVALGEAASMDVHLPQVVSTVLRHSVSIRFYDTVEAYELDVEVGHVEV